MNVYEFEMKINDTYKCNLYERGGNFKLYLNHTGHVTTFLELDVDAVGKKVVGVKPVCFYNGKQASGAKWYRNYTQAAREFIHEVASYAYSLIS